MFNWIYQKYEQKWPGDRIEDLQCSLLTITANKKLLLWCQLKFCMSWNAVDLAKMPNPPTWFSEDGAEERVRERARAGAVTSTATGYGDTSSLARRSKGRIWDGRRTTGEIISKQNCVYSAVECNTEISAKNPHFGITLPPPTAPDLVAAQPKPEPKTLTACSSLCISPLITASQPSGMQPQLQRRLLSKAPTRALPEAATHSRLKPQNKNKTSSEWERSHRQRTSQDTASNRRKMQVKKTTNPLRKKRENKQTNSWKSRSKKEKWILWGGKIHFLCEHVECCLGAGAFRARWVLLADRRRGSWWHMMTLLTDPLCWEGWRCIPSGAAAWGTPNISRALELLQQQEGAPENRLTGSARVLSQACASLELQHVWATCALSSTGC